MRGAAAFGVTSRASALAWLAALANGCGAEPVEARAIWVDDFGGEGRRRIHVYDRGRIEDFEVLGEGGPVEWVELDHEGRGVLVRVGDRGGAWFDLEDGRRLPLLLPSPSIGGGQAPLRFAVSALTWIEGLDGTLVVVPLAPELALERREDGTVAPLTRAASLRWAVPAERAPILFAAHLQGGHASFFRYPTRAEQPLAIALEAEADGLSSLPDTLSESRRGATLLDCWSRLSVEARGELALFASSEAGPWELFERRSPGSAGPLELPASLAEAQQHDNLRLLQVLDRAVSIWVGPAQVHRYDRTREQVDSLPLFLDPPIHWTVADQGRAVILSSGWGPVYRADLDGLRAVSVELTQCSIATVPVVSPNGRWLAWTCGEYVFDDSSAPQSAVVRVSELGLERYAGVPMATLAIDDEGDLLLYSVQTTSDALLEAVGPSSVPQNLFVLSGEGVLTRVDELEPAPAPVLVGIDLASYIQGVALAGGRNAL